MKKTMKWKLGVVLSLALLVGFGTWGVRPSWAVGTDVFDTDAKLYVPYWRVDPNIDTLLVLENPFGPGSNAIVRFYDKTCKFVRDFHTNLTTDDVDFIDVGVLLSPLSTGSPREGGLIVTTAGFGATGGADMTAETIVVNGVDGSLLRFHHINGNDATPERWTTFANFWTGTYFDANKIDNELFLFCPTKKAVGETINRMAEDLTDPTTGLGVNSPVGSTTAFTTGVDIKVFDESEDLLISIPLNCTCVTRVLMSTLTGVMAGHAGRIEITSTEPGFDSEDFIAFMKRQIQGTSFQVNGYMFSH